MSTNPDEEKPVETPVEAAASGPDILPPRAPDPQQGHSIAAWTTVLIVLLGALMGAIGLVFTVHWLSWIGLGVAVFGVILGKTLQAMGFGQVTEKNK